VIAVTAALPVNMPLKGVAPGPCGEGWDTCRPGATSHGPGTQNNATEEHAQPSPLLKPSYSCEVPCARRPPAQRAPWAGSNHAPADKSLGIAVPDRLLALADEVIE